MKRRLAGRRFFAAHGCLPVTAGSLMVGRDIRVQQMTAYSQKFRSLGIRYNIYRYSTARLKWRQQQRDLGGVYNAPDRCATVWGSVISTLRREGL